MWSPICHSWWCPQNGNFLVAHLESGHKVLADVQGKTESTTFNIAQLPGGFVLQVQFWYLNLKDMRGLKPLMPLCPWHTDTLTRCLTWQTLLSLQLSQLPPPRGSLFWPSCLKWSPFPTHSLFINCLICFFLVSKSIVIRFTDLFPCLFVFDYESCILAPKRGASWLLFLTP